MIVALDDDENEETDNRRHYLLVPCCLPWVRGSFPYCISEGKSTSTTTMEDCMESSGSNHNNTSSMMNVLSTAAMDQLPSSEATAPPGVSRIETEELSIRQDAALQQQRESDPLEKPILEVVATACASASSQNEDKSAKNNSLDRLEPPLIEAALLHEKQQQGNMINVRTGSSATVGTAVTTAVDSDAADTDDGSQHHHQQQRHGPSSREPQSSNHDSSSSSSPDNHNNSSSNNNGSMNDRSEQQQPHPEDSHTSFNSHENTTTIVEEITFSADDLGYNMDDDDLGLLGPDPPSSTQRKSSGRRTSVHFEFVEIREYSITIGDNPYCSRGVPISLNWDYSEGRVVPIDLFESANKRRRRKNARRMLLDPIQRRDLLWRCGHDLDDIEEAAKANEKENFRQSFNLYFLPVFVLQELWESQSERLRGWTSKVRGKRSKESEKSSNEAQVRQLHQIQLASVDTEGGGLPPWQRDTQNDKPIRRVSFRGRSGGVGLPSNDSFVSNHSIPSDGDVGDWESSYSDHSSAQRTSGSDMGSSVAGSTFRNAASDAKFSTYKIRTDPRQHDKATEIILCSIQRPHMRAFHASWFGFFIGFVMWFAVTPLLGEVKETLGLTNQEIWTSSLCGTAVTVLARVMMGPLCDVFGARKCMAAIVVVSAIPCGLTGLVNTATGLSAVRAFIGIAGSAFVPCQYWTSRMFAREVAGTANALVAGWGNLGGGVTQLLMGSALFPLFKLFFDDHDNAAEMAWRTVFVIPALVAFGAAYVYIFHSEDSPKGDFAELVRQQQIEIVSPFWSLGMAIQNRNVLLLLVQYACCFGVEITMTNATALYFKEEFGQDTVAAAAIASVFGIMNLFARGLGGYGSDFFNAHYGTKGRVVWQSITLFMEGIGIVVFAFAETLVGAIFSLIFLSFWVQCAEGSTYGIVPYVNRRFTGTLRGSAVLGKSYLRTISGLGHTSNHCCLLSYVSQELSWDGSVAAAPWEELSFPSSFVSSLTKRLSSRWDWLPLAQRFFPSL